MGNNEFQIIKVSSSAGGGKTTALAKRYIDLLKIDPENLKRTLAITFTNKAANEMKERIMNILKEKGLKGDKDAEKLVEKIIDNFSDFSIKTIDSFTYSLIRAFSFELGINYETEVILDTEDYMRIAFEKMLEKVISDEFLKKIFNEYNKIYLTREEGKSIYYWERIYKTLCKMIKEMKDNKIKLIDEKEIKDIDEFSYVFHILIKVYEESIESVEREERVILINRFNDYIKRLYESEFSPPFIYYKIGNLFKHFLIDEFQDTSRIQWENLYPLIENAISEGGTFFYVGDPKQSIYQWRGGDPTLFEYASGMNFKMIENKLNKNYRSCERIFRFVFDIFKMEEIRDIVKDIKLNLDIYKDVEQEILKDKIGKGYVVLRNVKEKERIDDFLIEDIKEIAKRWNYSDIAILTRKRDEANDIAKLLSSNSIPYVSKENLNIFENDIICEIVSFLKFLNTPTSNIDFFNFITGRCFEKISGLNKDIIIDEIIDSKYDYLYIIFKERFKDEWENFILPIFNKVGYISTYELVIEIFTNFRLYEHFKDETAFFEGFLEFVFNLEDKGYSFSMILDDMERGEYLVKQGEYQNAILISTVHNVKGLEFPVVILPYTTHNFNVDAISKEFFIGNEEKIFVKKFKNDNYEIIEEEYKKIARKKFEEELNILYVALTRAKEEMYIYYIKDKNDKLKISHYGLGELWNKIFNIYTEKKGEEDVIIGEPLFVGKKMEEELYTEIVRNNKYEELINSVVFKKSSIERDEEILGEAFHKLISMVKDFKKDEFLKNIDIVVSGMIQKYRKDYFRERLLFLSEKLLEWDEAIEILKKGGMVEKWGYDEEGLLRMDRIIFDNDFVIVIDFKTGKEKEDDLKQVERYKRFLKNVYYDKIVKGEIFYIMEKKRMEV